MPYTHHTKYASSENKRYLHLLFTLNTFGLSDAYITLLLFHGVSCEWINEKWNIYEFNLISNVIPPTCEMWSLKMQSEKRTGMKRKTPANHFWITLYEMLSRWYFFVLPYFHMNAVHFLEEMKQIHRNAMVLGSPVLLMPTISKAALILSFLRVFFSLEKNV